MTKLLTEAEAREVIEQGKIGRLGCIDNGEPYVVPINYVLDDNAIYSHSLPGKKTAAMKSHPRVCLQVDKIDDDLHWQSAIAFGLFEEIHGVSDRRRALSRLLSRFPKLTPVESMMVHDASSPDSIVFRILIDRITGVAEA